MFKIKLPDPPYRREDAAGMAMPLESIIQMAVDAGMDRSWAENELRAYAYERGIKIQGGGQ